MENELEQHIMSLDAYEYTLLNTICDYSNITLAELVGQVRKNEYVNARKIASLIMSSKGYTYNYIGKVISLIPKDHTTIMYHIDKANAHYRIEPEFKNIVDSVNNVLFKQNFTSFKYKKNARN